MDADSIVSINHGGTGCKTKEELRNLIRDIFYPIGRLWISYSSTSPASILGGSWTQITGRFLRMANDVNTGGADTITLTVAQMPKHTHVVQYFHDESQTRTGANTFWWQTHYSDAGRTTTSAGGSTAHSNTPAYQDLYAWRRTA